MTMTSKDRAALRGEAHHLTAAVHIGHQGLTPTVIETLDDALRTRELVKVQLAKTTDETPKVAAQQSGGADGLRSGTGHRADLHALSLESGAQAEE